MKQTNMIFGFIWIFVAVVLCWIFISKMRGNSSIKIYSLRGNEISVDDGGMVYKEEIFNGREVSEIEVDVASESVHYEAVSGNELTIELRGKGWDSKNEPKITLKGNKLTVKTPNNHSFKISTGPRRVLVKIPETSMKNNLKIENNSASGSVHVSDIDGVGFKINEASGSAHVNNCTFEKMDIDSASGSIHVNDSDIKFIDVDSASGSTHLNGKFEKFDIESTSGSININSDVEIKKDSKIETASGSVNIKVPSKSTFNVKYDTLSGSFKNEFDSSSRGKHGSYSVEGNYPTLSIETVSGSIRILKE